MPRLIDGDALLGVLNTYIENFRNASDKSAMAQAIEAGMGLVLVAVYRAPTIDAEPVRHGRWMPVELGRGEHKCSVCYRQAPYFASRQEYQSAYCPHCGAKMDAKEDG